MSLLRAPLTVGIARAGDPIRIILAADAGALRVVAADREHKPVQDAGVCVIPEDVGNPGELAYYYVPYGTNQDGYHTIQNLRPGKYYVLATPQPYDATPANLTKLLQARSQAKEIDLAPGRTVDVTLEPLVIR